MGAAADGRGSCWARQLMGAAPDAKVEAVLGPAVHGTLWRAICTAVADAGWRRVTVDAFASAANARTPRIWSRFLEPGAEAVDALVVLDWAQSRCPECGSVPRVRVYASQGRLRVPSVAPRTATVEKAVADRALCVLVLPVAILAPYWSKLLYASFLPRAAPYADGFLRFCAPNARLLHVGGYAPRRLRLRLRPPRSPPGSTRARRVPRLFRL